MLPIKKNIVILSMQGGGKMKIFYKQPEQERQSSLSRFDIQNCYFKELVLGRDQNSITKKLHHHKGFEIHIVIDGYQEYAIDGINYKLQSGTFLLIYPNVSHTVVAWKPYTKKYSITFNKQVTEHQICFFGKITERIVSNLDFILNEASQKKEISSSLLENNILEILVWAFRLSGIEENENTQKQDENVMISLAKQYIEDNVEMGLNVSDVAAYCYLSAKQLTRMFQKFEGVSPGKYIINRRISTAQKLLADDSFSLKQISEMMNFNNEYYFNAFFKKHSGMPPGEYRRMLGK